MIDEIQVWIFDITRDAARDDDSCSSLKEMGKNFQVLWVTRDLILSNN